MVRTMLNEMESSAHFESLVNSSSCYFSRLAVPRALAEDMRQRQWKKIDVKTNALMNVTGPQSSMTILLSVSLKPLMQKGGLQERGLGGVKRWQIGR